jgi:hypothetical protein
MPNPLAHPAAAIPFTKARLVFSALVIGSIAPDFGYFFKVGQGYFMYTLPGLFLYDLPVGLVLLGLFQLVAKWPLLSLAPIGLQRRLIGPARRFSFGPAKRFGLILLSLVVGSITHILWDSFTHDYGWMVEKFAFFKTPVAGIPLYNILQTLSTWTGIGLLIYWFIRWLPKAPRTEEAAAHFSGKVQGLFLALTALALAIVEGLILYSRFLSGAQTLHRHLWAAAGIVDSAFFIIFFFLGIYCLAWLIAFHRTTR